MIVDNSSIVDQSSNSGEAVKSVDKSVESNPKDLFANARAERLGTEVKPEAPKVESADKLNETVDIQNKSDVPKDKKNSDKPNKAQERIGELTRKSARDKERIKSLEAELAKVKNQPAPDRDKIGDDTEYIRQVAERNADAKAITRELDQAKQATEQAETESWNERIRSEVKDYDKFAQGYTKHLPEIAQVDPYTIDFVEKSEVGIGMLEEILAKCEDPQWKAKFLGLPTAKRFGLLNDLENYVLGSKNSQTNKPAPTKSNAPASVAPSRQHESSGGTSPKDLFAQARAERLNKSY